MDDWDLVDEPEASPRNPVVERAIVRIMTMLDASPRRLFYTGQIQTQLEGEFFHWITGRALLELSSARQIAKVTESIAGNSTNFYANRKHRYLRRELKEMCALLARIFDPDFTHAIGRQGEQLVDVAFARNAFRIEARDANTWKGKTYLTTDHNLDRIVSRDGITYGVEVKNTQNYIPRDELFTKLDICRELQLVPLLVMRYAPKSYMHEINQQRGFGLLYEHQLYPWGHEALLKEVRTRLN